MMTYGEIIDELEETIHVQEIEKRLVEAERDVLLYLLFDAIETETYINPLGIMAYLKTVYPNRWSHRVEQGN